MSIARLTAAAVVVAVLLTAPATSQEPPAAPRLFRPDAEGRQVPLVADSNVTRSRRVRVDTGLLGGAGTQEQFIARLKETGLR